MKTSTRRNDASPRNSLTCWSIWNRKAARTFARGCRTAAPFASTRRSSSRKTFCPCKFPCDRHHSCWTLFLLLVVHFQTHHRRSLLYSWFRHSNYSSFQRQLNIYGFTRIVLGIDKNAYYHENFVRGDYHRTLHIGRRAIKGHERPPPRKDEPNFYRTMVTPSSSSSARNEASSGVASIASLAQAPLTSSPSSVALEMLLLHRNSLAEENHVNAAAAPPPLPLSRLFDSTPNILSSTLPQASTSSYSGLLGLNRSWSVGSRLSSLHSSSALTAVALGEWNSRASSLRGEGNNLGWTTAEARSAAMAVQAQTLLDALQRRRDAMEDPALPSLLLADRSGNLCPTGDLLKYYGCSSSSSSRMGGF